MKYTVSFLLGFIQPIPELLKPQKSGVNYLSTLPKGVNYSVRCVSAFGQSLIIDACSYGQVVRISYGGEVMLLRSHICNDIVWVGFSIIFWDEINTVEDAYALRLASVSISGGEVSYKPAISEGQYVVSPKNKLDNPFDPVINQSSNSKDETTSVPTTILQPELSSLHARTIVHKMLGFRNEEGEVIGLKPHLRIFGDELLTGRFHWQTEEVKLSSSLAYAGIWLTCTEYFSKQLSMEINPFSFILRRIENLPRSILDEKFESISCEISLGSMIEPFTLPAYPIESDLSVQIDYVYTVYTNKIGRNEVLVNLQTKPLLVKIFGSKVDEVIESTNYKVYGQKMKDDRIALRELNHSLTESDIKHAESKGRKLKTQTSIHLLGTCAIDCSNLARGPRREEICASVSSRPFPTGSVEERAGLYDGTPTDILKIHCGTETWEECWMKTENVAQSATSIDIQICLAHPIRVCHFSPVNKFTLIVAISHSHQYSDSLLKRIISANKEHLGLQHCVPIFNRYQPLRTPKSARFDNVPDAVISGFYIGSREEQLFVIECSIQNSLSRILCHVLKLSPSAGRILYSSELYLTKRMYEDLIVYGSFYCIEVGQSIRSIISNKKANLAGNMPKPTFKTLHCLDKLTHCTNIFKACQLNYFPKATELISFDTEFGIPTNFN